MSRRRQKLRHILLAIAAAALTPSAALAQGAGLGAAGELVDPEVLRVPGFRKSRDHLLVAAQVTQRKQQHDRDDGRRAPVRDGSTHGASVTTCDCRLIAVTGARRGRGPP